MKKIGLVIGLIFLFSVSFQVHAQNFFPTKQGDAYQIREQYYNWIEPNSIVSFHKSLANEINFNNKTYVWAWNNYYYMDTTLNKLFIIVDNEEKLAFDFNKQSGDTDVLYISGYGLLYTYSDIENSVILGENRMTRKITNIGLQESTKWTLVDGIGLYEKEFTNQVGYFWRYTDVISAIINGESFNPINLDVSTYFPAKISRNQLSFSFLVNINAPYMALVDSLNANVVVYKSDSLIFQKSFNGQIDLKKITINISQQILSIADSIGIQVYCTDNSIYNNKVYFPQSGYKFIPLEESSWSLFIPQIYGTRYMAMKFFSSNVGHIFAGSGDMTNLEIYRNSTTNGGTSFTETLLPRSNWNYYQINEIISCNQNSGYMIYEKLRKTTDQGLTWNNLLNFTVQTMSFLNEDTGWVSQSYDKTIYRTYNGGLSWETLQTNLSEDFKLINFAEFSEGYGITYSGKVYRSTDGGATWHFTNAILSIPKKFKMFNNGIGWSIGAGIWKTQDYGDTWLQQYDGNFVDAKFFSQYRGIVIGTINGTNIVLQTVDGGVSWNPVEVQVTQGSYINVDFVDETHGWIFTSSKELLKTTNGGVTFIEDEKNNFVKPEQFLLHQNYPNPFSAKGGSASGGNPSTKISWQSPISSWQTLKIYDILGNEVATLVDEYRNAGSYQVDFNPASSIRNLASGIYFYQLRVGDFIETKKMILLK